MAATGSFDEEEYRALLKHFKGQQYNVYFRFGTGARIGAHKEVLKAVSPIFNEGTLEF